MGGAQLGEIVGVKGPDSFLSHWVGHEGGDRVLEVGAGVTHVKPGDHAVLYWRKRVEIQSGLPQYKWGDTKVNAGWVTTADTYFDSTSQ